MTLWEIAGNPDDIIVTHGGPSKKNKRFAGWITRGEGHNGKPLVSTAAVFKTPELAETFMQKIVDFAQDFTEEDLKDIATNPENPLHFLAVDQEELDIIQDIVAAAKG